MRATVVADALRQRGEEATPLVTDLGSLGFAGEDAWAERRFCGGLGGEGCASPVRDKLLRNPF